MTRYELSLTLIDPILRSQPGKAVTGMEKFRIDEKASDEKIKSQGPEVVDWMQVLQERPLSLFPVNTQMLT
jgi:hypothetical protein